MSTNAATQAVGMWIDNDEGMYTHKNSLVEEADSVDELADSLKDWIEENNPLADEAGLFNDLLTNALQRVEWHKLAREYWEEKKRIEEEVAEDDESLPFVREDIQRVRRCDECGDTPEEDETVSYRAMYHVWMCDFCYGRREEKRMRS